MTLTFAGMLLALVTTVTLGAVLQTLVRYGARVLGLGDELGICREHIEMRVALRACTGMGAAGAPLAAAFIRAAAPAPAVFPAAVPAAVPAPARAAIPYRSPDVLRAAA
jgi:hypothetical protein